MEAGNEPENLSSGNHPGSRLLSPPMTIIGVGGLGASARFAPQFTKLVGATAVVYVGGKAITHPGSRKGLAGLLRMIDEAAQKTTDPAVLRQLRTDRAAIVELLKTSVEAIEETG